MDIDSSSRNGGHEDDMDHGIRFKDWGFKIDRLFEVAYRFYKRNEGKVFHPSFDVRNQMHALILQSRFGNFDNKKSPDVGVLDLVGKGRRHQWSSLKAYAEAVKISTEVPPSINIGHHDHDSSDETTKQIASDEQLQAIHTSLCRQTYDQFKSFAEKQHPNDIPKQKYLISEMQKQYCEKYISQIHPEASKNLNMSSSASSISNFSQSPEQSENSSTEQQLNPEKTDKAAEDKVIMQKLPEIVDAKFEPFPEPCEIKRHNIPRSSTLDNNSAIMSNRQCNQDNDTSLYELNGKNFTAINIPNDPSPVQSQQQPDAKPITLNQLSVPNEQRYSEPLNEATQEILDTSKSYEQSTTRQVDTWSCGSSSGTSSPLQRSMIYEPLEPATTWTKKSVDEFKASLTNDKHGGLYTVKQGTTLIIQVPTYPDGRYIYWEFTTDEFDIGFGLDFIYESNLVKPLALKIYEEITDDYDDDDDIDEVIPTIENTNANGNNTNNNIAADTLERNRLEKIELASRTISILPTYRRDSHEEVFVGRHRYPGPGYYLLKFDNTYSVLRSKSLSFRICYFI